MERITERRDRLLSDVMKMVKRLRREGYPYTVGEGFRSEMMVDYGHYGGYNFSCDLDMDGWRQGHA